MFHFYNGILKGMPSHSENLETVPGAVGVRGFPAGIPVSVLFYIRGSAK